MEANGIERRHPARPTLKLVFLFGEDERIGLALRYISALSPAEDGREDGGIKSERPEIDCQFFNCQHGIRFGINYRITSLIS